MKTILFCGNGMSAESIRQVKSWGYRVLLLTDFLQDRGVEDADVVLQATTKNLESAVAAAEHLVRMGYSFDGVMSLCWDCPISVSVIAQQYGLAAVDVESAYNATNKSRRSQCFQRCNVPSPAFRVVSGFQDLRTAALEIGLPVVVKPTDLSSSKGVSLVEHVDELEAALTKVRSLSNDASVIVNEFVTGTEHSTEGLMINGTFHPTAISDRIFKYAEFKPHFVESGDIMPTSLPESVVQEMFEITGKAALSVGIGTGVVKGDLIRSDDGSIKVLEVTPRPGGPRFGTEMVPLSNGTNLLRAAVQQAVGDPIDLSLLASRWNRGMVNRSLFPRPGIYRGITGLEDVKTLPGFYDFKWWNLEEPPIGSQILKPESGCGDFAYLIATGATRSEALQNADRIEKHLVVTVEEALNT